jgi:hypothetical protein
LPNKTLKRSDVVRANRVYQIIWLISAEEEFLFSANGQSFVVAAHPNLRKLVRRLNRGRASTVEALLTEYSGRAVARGITFEATRRDIRKFLEKLCSFRAINVVPRRPSL